MVFSFFISLSSYATVGTAVEARRKAVVTVYAQGFAAANTVLTNAPDGCATLLILPLKLHISIPMPR